MNFDIDKEVKIKHKLPMLGENSILPEFCTGQRS